MQLEKLAAVLRPRNGSESAELGLQMLGRWRGQIYRAWFLVATPIWLVCTVLAFIEPALGIILFWWLKPLMERAPLYVVSDRLFGGDAKLGGLFAGHAKLWKDFFVNHTFRRFNVNRGVLAPVAMLEGLTGSAFSKRSRVISRSSGSLLGLTVACFVIAAHVVLAVYLFLLLFTPEPYHWIYTWRWESSDTPLVDFANFVADPKPIWEQLLHCVIVFLMISVTSPVYAVCGFAVYINRRTEIECWDIELQFRKIAKRIANISIVLLGIWVVAPEPAYAQVDCNTRDAKINELRGERSEAKRELAEVLERAEFTRCQQRVVYNTEKGDSSKNTNSDRGQDRSRDQSSTGSSKWSRNEQGAGPNIGDLLLVVAGIAILFMLFVVMQKLGWVARSKSTKVEPVTADVVFAETPVELRADGDLETAKSMWGADEHREALALLYRTAVLRLHEHYRAPIGTGATEGDCLRWAKRNLKEQKDLIRCLTILTRHWQWVAYGHRMPELDFDELVDLWSRTFARLADD